MGERVHVYPLADLDQGIHICCDTGSGSSNQNMSIAWRAAFYESPEHFSAPKSHFYKHEPLILHGCHFKIYLRPENFNL